MSAAVGTVGPFYRVLAWFLGVVVNTFFRRVEVVGRENVPDEGPVIFAGNHPNALMDGFVVTTMCGRRPVHFMANVKLWRYRLLAVLLDTLGAVPVFPREEHGHAASNEAAFDSCSRCSKPEAAWASFQKGSATQAASWPV